MGDFNEYKPLSYSLGCVAFFRSPDHDLGFRGPDLKSDFNPFQLRLPTKRLSEPSWNYLRAKKGLCATIHPHPQETGRISVVQN